jgi:pimeloyl-[acyl-carrier protein] methyl ester esterase
MDTPRPTLLLLPGLEGSGELFSGLIEEFADRLDTRVARYPSACCAYAGAAHVVRELMREVVAGSSPFVLVAESFSTPLAIQIAADAQSEIHGLVLCNGFVANPLSAFESMMASASASWFFHLPLTSVAARAFLVGPNASDGLVEAVQSVVAPVSPQILSARLSAVLSCDAREALARIRVPVLYLHATRDRLIGGSGLKEILRIKSDVMVERVDGPHLLLQKEPKKCAEIIARFVEQIESVQKASGAGQRRKSSAEL